MQPPLTSITFLSTLDRLGIRHVTTDFEADQLAAALALYLGVPLISNDSDFFIFSPYWSAESAQTSLVYIPTDLCDFETPVPFDGGFYLSAQQFDPKGRAFCRLSSIHIPLFAVLCGNDYVPPGFFNSKLPGSASQMPYVRPTGQAASRSAVTSRNAEKFRRLSDWLSGFSNDIVEPVQRVMSKFPMGERDQAARFLYAGLASYHLPMDEVSIYVKWLFGEKHATSAVNQTIPDLESIPQENYGLKAVQVLARGLGNQEPLPDWSETLTTAYRRRRIMPALCDALFAFGNMMGPVIEDYANREPYHLCSLPLRRLFMGLLLSASRRPDDVDSRRPRRLQGLISDDQHPAYREYTRVGCKRFENHRIAFSWLSIGESGPFGFLQEHLLLPPRPTIIPPWLHGLACILFLWARFDARPEAPRLCLSTTALAVCACAVAAQMRLLRERDGGTFDRAATVQYFESLYRPRRIEPLQFSILHALAQLQSIHYHLSTLVALVGALGSGESDSGGTGVGLEVPAPQLVFPSGKLVHHIALHLGGLPPAQRLSAILSEWIPRLLGNVDETLLIQVRLTRLIFILNSFRLKFLQFVVSGDFDVFGSGEVC